jgi:single-strand selective monofunctional uracil DNA glycosylase
MTSLVDISGTLRDAVDALDFGDSVAHVYNPLRYAWDAHTHYLTRYGEDRPLGRVLLIGMNPGPWGMMQTGVPFGAVGMVRDWLGIEAPIGAPRDPHPKHPILGFATTREEVSGARLWGWARDRFGTPDAFFNRFFVHNCIPLAFLNERGANVTPDKLPASVRDPLLAVSDAALRSLVEHLAPSLVVGIGTFAESRAQAATHGLNVRIGRILHPSPASPAANRGWAPQAERALAALGVDLP